MNEKEREYNINFPCVTTVAATAGANAASSCGTEFDRRYNPSNTGNIRGASKFSFGESVTLTVDPSFQYVKANGGGTVNARERLVDILPGSGVTNVAGYVGGRPYFGVDLNGDGDLLDEVAVLAPSQTQTRRYGVIANLRWDINEAHTVRFAYTYDRAQHRQTGQVGFLNTNGEPLDVFPVNDAATDVTGAVLQKRDRKSIALLNQVSGEYRGEFMDGNLITTVGLRAPFFKRDLNNYCFTTSVSGFVDCFGQGNPRNATYAAANPTVQGPQQRVLKYSEVLPNVGLLFKPGGLFTVFANYSKGLQVPGTDALYNAFFFAPNTASARPRPETSDNFDLGVRYRSNNIQAQLTGWFTRYSDRLATAFDPETDRNVYRNLGRVDKYGFDGSIAWQPAPQIALYAFGSYLKSKIKDNVQAGECTAAQVTASFQNCAAVGSPLYIITSGRREAGAPEYTYGVQGRGFIGPFDLGLTAKRTGGRYIYDNNLPIFAGTAATPTLAYPAKTNAYWLVNLDARLNLKFLGLNDKTFFQLNVYNLFDSLYVRNFPTGLNQGGVLGSGALTGNPAAAPFAQIGAPRTISGTINFQF